MTDSPDAGTGSDEALNSGNDPMVVLLEHRPDFKSIYGINLNVYIGAEIKAVATVKQAADILKTFNVSMIFVDASGYATDVAYDIFTFIEKNRLKTHLFIMGRTKVPPTEAEVFDKNMQLKHVLQNVARILSVSAKDMAEKKVPEYFPLSMEYVLPGWFCSTEVYSKNKNDYECQFNTEDIITFDTLEDLQKSGIKQLYIKANARLKFANSISTQISAKLKDPNLSPEERIKTVATGYQVVAEQARAIGISESSLDIAKACIESIDTITDGMPSLDKLFQYLKDDKASYRYQLCLFISFIGGHIIKRMQWGSREQQKKLTFVSFFSNICLIRDDLVKFSTDEEVDESNLTEKEKEFVKNHAFLAAKMVRGLEKSFPLGADTIIKQHHGSKTGKGLSQLSIDISPLAAVFIVAEQWAHHMLNSEGKESPEDTRLFIVGLKEKYNKPAFKQVFPALEELKL